MWLLWPAIVLRYNEPDQALLTFWGMSSGDEDLNMIL